MSAATSLITAVAKRVGLSLRNRFIKWLDPDTGLWRGGGYFPTEAGVNVSAESAMRVTAVFACVRILAWTLASMPLFTYRRLKPRGKERAPDHQLYRVLHDAPNTEQSSFQFRALLMAHVVLWGNGYAEIEFDARGNIVGLWPIPPWRVTPERTKDTGALFYNVIPINGGAPIKIPAWQMFHLPGLSLDGLKGLSPIEQARQSIGLTLAAEEFGARFFGSGTHLGGVAMHPNKLSPEAYGRLKDSLNEKYVGLGRSHRILFLEEGMKFEQMGISPDHAQFLETRRFQIADICRLFGVPSFMVNDTERTTSWGTGIEQMGIGLVVYTLRPYCVSFEQEAQRKLFLGDQEYFSEFLVDGLLRGDIAARYTSYAIGRQWGWLSADDVRELENMNPLPDGQGAIYLNPLNMISAKAYTKPIDPKKPLPAPEPPDDDRDAQVRVVEGFRFVLADAAQRILKREEADVMRQARKLDAAALGAWLEKFYSEHREYVLRQITPVMDGLVEASDLPGRIGDVSCAGGPVDKHVTRSLQELQALVAAGGDVAGALQTRFEEWTAERAGEFAASVIQFAVEGRIT